MDVKKFSLVFMGLVLMVGCNGVVFVSVSSVEITPPGDTVSTTLTAEIEAEGEGSIKVQWHHAVYDSVSLAWTDEIEVTETGTYTSIYEAHLGWYWIDIRDEDDSLLWHTDSVFCGPDNSQPVVDFTADPESGISPLTVTFTNNSSQDEYTRVLWDFGDGNTSTEWESEHTYETAGQYTVTLTVLNLAGSANDSVIIQVEGVPSVVSVDINPPGSEYATTLTATIQAVGQGRLVVQWLNAVYDTVSLPWNEEISVISDGEYISTYESGLGWYWLDIYDVNDNLLWHTDSVFCGSDSSLPEVSFFADWEYGPHPLDVMFFNETEQTEYTKALWDFDDEGATDTVWDQPEHTYQNPGEYRPKLRVFNLAGSSIDSTYILVW